MKKILLILSLILGFTAAKAQTPFSTMSSHSHPAVDTAFHVEALSLDNAWVGASLLYNVKGDVSNSIGFKGRALYEVFPGIPVLSNFTLEPTDTLFASLSLGVFPYKVIAQNDNFKLLVHGGADYSYTNQKTNSLSVFGGFEGALYGGSGLPITLSVTPELDFNLDGTNVRTWQLGVTGVYPITAGIGFLVDANVPFKNGVIPDVSFGFVVANQLKD